ncbi:hypothetical protein D3C72_1811440 [compost metagenome]
MVQQHQRQALQLGPVERDGSTVGLAPHQRLVGGQHGHKGVVQQGNVLQIAQLGWLHHHAKMHVAIADLGQHLLLEPVHQLQLHLRQIAAAGGNAGGHQRCRQGRAAGHAHHTARGLAHICHLVQRVGQLLQQGRHALGEQLARLGKQDFACSAVEQPHIQLAFQLHHGAADG